ncbi:pyridoxine 5'-phosphate synthase [candidate division WOR-1 bacterium RIFOXYB2_FULL_48_7]|uniref:Pyridoxine 5'-phosphate synthase n=1 Tax=candidate division WOR-1 bacterium RIFOXYB2_FULL_48_7 TaxID=1802583 RepID=A0A1F4TMX2_UNCSA|nr:MAG: pyridoxine 5'-phosphate synthase [candidate division WOR-1 bacterium RIFOXYB2_FULL_48_7]
MRLGVNVDHIATLRQARLEGLPDPIALAEEALAGGADGIVCHLREDRRHIQDSDVVNLRKLKTRLDLEMAATSEMLKFALKVKPDMVTLVPEKRAELTTEGGLDVVKQTKKLKPVIEKLQKAGILVSLFIEPEPRQVEESAVLTADFIELHTGAYARKPNKTELTRLSMATEKAKWIGLRVNAGHGLDYQNVHNIVQIYGLEELNIGFSIIARSVVVGMKQAVSEMRRAIG